MARKWVLGAVQIARSPRPKQYTGIIKID